MQNRLTSLYAALTGTVLLALVSGCSDKGTTAPPFDPGNSNLVWIEPGMFTMGSPKRWTGTLLTWPPTLKRKRISANEGPQTEVEISRGFWIGKYELTQGEYLDLVKTNPSFFNGVFEVVDYGTDLRRPVESVSWNDATNFCALLTLREQAAGRIQKGFKYRLPTEAEWEYACRAGTTRQFSYGDDLDLLASTNFGWFADSLRPKFMGNSDHRTHPVGQKRPNPWGIYDMHGNVAEWCLDKYSRNYPGGSVTNPMGLGKSSTRVHRGGSWEDAPIRSADRNWEFPMSTGIGLGFRVVLAPCRE